MASNSLDVIAEKVLTSEQLRDSPIPADISGSDVFRILQEILVQLKVMNIQFSAITGEAAEGLHPDMEIK